VSGAVVVDGTVYVPSPAPDSDWVPLLAVEDVYATEGA
jgi:hypothetical protein